MRKKWTKRVLLIGALLLAIAAGLCYQMNSGNSLKDGTYFPEFSFTGGSGRVEIRCEKVVVENGQAMATLLFESPNYTWVKAEGTQYDNQTPAKETGMFEIPVKLEEPTPITAQTTAMSTPHEISYELFVSLSGKEKPSGNGKSEEEAAFGTEKRKTDIEEIPVISGLTYSCAEEIEYADCFRIYHYEDDYTVIRISDGRDYLLIPEGGKVPEACSEHYTVLEKNPKHIYLVASSAMSMFEKIGALSSVRLTGTKAENWYADTVREAMEKKEILFAGKYSAPDYELLVSEKCDLSIESTMILHSPEVQEKMEEMGIPVLVERSSYENHPLGRTEWIKLYGVLTGHSEEAKKAFDEQKNYVLALEDFENTEKTVAFFYVNQNGMIVTKKSSDYIPAMIELAGGRYIFEHLGEEENASSSVNMTMEEFYAAAKDADYLVYNGAIDDPLDSVGELISKSELFADFYAVKNGNVWSTDKYLYQAANENGQMIQDFHRMLTDDSAENLKFIYRMKQ